MTTTTETIKALRDALANYMANASQQNYEAAMSALALPADASEDAPRQITYCEEEWITKTDWVQKDFQKDLFPLAHLGQHRADIMRDEIARLRRVIAHSAPVGQQAGAVDGDASCQ